MNRFLQFYTLQEGRIIFAMELDAEFTQNVLKLKDEGAWEMSEELYPNCKNAEEAIVHTLDNKFHFGCKDEEEEEEEQELVKHWKLLAPNLRSQYIFPACLQTKLQGVASKTCGEDWRTRSKMSGGVSLKMSDFLWQWLDAAPPAQQCDVDK